MKFFYPPKKIHLLADVFILLITYFIVLSWIPLTTNTPFKKYFPTFFVFTIAWLVISYLFKRYKPFNKFNYFKRVLSLFYTSTLLFFVFLFLLHFFFKPYSGYVLLLVVTTVFVVNYLFVTLYYAYRYAVEYNDITTEYIPRTKIEVKPAVPLDDDSYNQVCEVIKNHSPKAVLDFLDSNVDVRSGNTRIFLGSENENLKMYPNYQYSTIVQLERLNNMRGINSKLSIVNEKLPDNGIFICCFESKSTWKKQILTKYPWGINYVIYTLCFIYKRVLPKIFLTRKFYYFISRGKNRIFTKTEVLGRLYCFGFEVIKQKKIKKLTYVVARRIKEPEKIHKRIYGPLIRLKRYGKQGKLFEVYKMRTMHPYSEFLQAYIHEHNSLKKGGKFNKDIRITTLGNFMRKYWLDELPMFINLIKGEMKLVGVRPLSKHYFSLYSKELQELRIQHKPGLLPPFYADMPVTLEEIQQSELNYLNACDAHGTFKTDTRYFFKIVTNIVIKKARSA